MRAAPIARTGADVRVLPRPLESEDGESTLPLSWVANADHKVALDGVHSARGGPGCEVFCRFVVRRPSPKDNTTKDNTTDAAPKKEDAGNKNGPNKSGT